MIYGWFGLLATVLSIPLPPDCKECVNTPIMLHDHNSGNVLTSIIYHPGDDPVAVAREACMAIGRSTDDCLQALLAKINEGDWMARFQVAATVSSRGSEWSMSRHEKLTIMKRLRTFEQPRRLLVIGAGASEAMFWVKMNSRKEGGFTCFIEREVPVPQRSDDAVHDVLAISQILSDEPFTQIAYDIEKIISPTRQWRDYDMWEMHKEIPSNFSFIPWDAVVLYDICRDADTSTRQRCTQLYFDFAVARTVDDGFFFLQYLEDREDVRQAEEKFLYRFDLSRHLGSATPLRYYSSLDVLGTPTVAGQRKRTQSQSAAAVAALTSCVKNEFETGYKLYQVQKQQTTGDMSSGALRQQAVDLLKARGYSRVIGVLFCCRKRYSSILQGYLERNLASAGGLIDHILVYNFGSTNDDPAYPTWLGAQPGFVMRPECSSGLFGCAYASLGDVDAHALYVKFDDDLLFLGEGAIEAMVLAKCGHQGPSIVHGNGVNHLHTPYLHTLLPPTPPTPPTPPIASASLSSSTTVVTNRHDSPSVHACHNGTCPATTDTASPPWEFYGRDWQSPVKAQEQHTAFLERMATDVASAEQHYWFDQLVLSTCRCSSPQPGTGLCSTQGYYRTSINLVCFGWDDIRPHVDLLAINDEIALTVLIPERAGHQTVVVGRALYAHAAFTPQRESTVVGKLDETKVLERYRELAERYLHTRKIT